MSRGTRTGLALAGLAGVLFAGVATGYGFYALRWACPEEQRLHSTGEVEAAFAGEGLELEPTEIAVAVPEGAKVYRHVAEDAMVYVLVCRDFCSESGPDTSTVSYSAGDGPPQWNRYGVGFDDVDIWITDADRRSFRSLMAPVHRIVDELAPPTPDRCYIG